MEIYLKRTFNGMQSQEAVLHRRMKITSADTYLEDRGAGIIHACTKQKMKACPITHIKSVSRFLPAKFLTQPHYSLKLPAVMVV